MQIEIQSDLLKDALNKLQGVVDRKISRPILTNCLVSNENQNLILMASDTEVSVKMVLKAKIIDQGNFCINIKNFSDILRELPSDIVVMKIENDKNLLSLSCA